MNRTQTITHSLFAIACAFFIHTKSFAEPANIGSLKQEIRQYHDSGTYLKEIEQSIAPAQAYIIQRAQENANRTPPEKLAIVFDIDETSLSNYKSIAAGDFAFDKAVWDRDLQTQNAPAIEPILALYRVALQHKVAVFFVSGRSEVLQKRTIENLKNAGFNEWSALYLRPKHYKTHSIEPFKIQVRSAIEKKGYVIIASVGDQQSDLSGGYAEKTFKLPNPYYHVP